MRIKIPRRGLCTAPYRDGGGGSPVEKEVAKKDVAEEPTHQLVVADSAELNTGEDYLALAIPSTPSPASKGKRKMKPKELYSDICYETKRRGRKPSLTTSKDVVQSVPAGKSNSCRQQKTPAMVRAEELHSSLGSEFPSFVRVLLRSHVDSCFWMGLPMPFCKSHLPKHDTTITLEDESGEESELKFFAAKTALSGGWRKFAVGHDLVFGDVLIFQLVEPHKFKVFIVRANDSNEADGALTRTLTRSSKQDHARKEEAENVEIPETNKKRKCVKPLPSSVVGKKIKRTRAAKPVTALQPYPNDSKEVVVYKSPCTTAVPFKDIKSFDDFSIVVNGVCIDSDLPHHVRYKYYKLCSNRNAFVHGRLLQGLNSKLVAGVISETVNIADAIRACKVTTSRDDFATWEKTLRSFELMGMKVGFLRARVPRLLGLAFGSGEAERARSYVEAKRERARAEEEIKKLEAKIVELKAAADKCCADMEDLEADAESYEKKFQEEVDAPW